MCGRRNDTENPAGVQGYLKEPGRQRADGRLA
jgi:hypothetical protein